MGAKDFGRTPASVLEAELDECIRTHGVDTCTAGRVETGDAQAGAASTLTLRAAASAVDDAYKNMVLRLVAGAGSVQERKITGYVGATKVATVSPRWRSNHALWSGAFSNAAWVVGDAANPKTPNTIELRAPDGSFSACKWVLNSIAANRSFGQQTPVNAVPARTDVFSFDVWIPSSNSANPFSAYMFAANGLDIPGDPINLNALPRDQWVRAVYVHTWNGAAGGVIVVQFHGNFPDTVGDRMYVRDPMLEIGVATAGEYIETQAAAIAFPDATSDYHVIDRPNACFNTYKTCQDKAAFSKRTKTVYFCKPAKDLPHPYALDIRDDGAGSFASSPDSAALDIAGDWEIETMVFPTGQQLDAAAILTRVYPGSAVAISYVIAFEGNGNDARPYVGFFSAGNWYRAVGPAALETRRLYKINGIKRGTDLELWIDGVLVDTTPGVPAATPANDSGLRIGRRWDNAETFRGRILYAFLRNGVGGPIVASYDSADARPGDRVVKSSRTGELWTIEGNAQLIQARDMYTFIPSVKGISTRPSRINAGGQSKSSGALGERGTISAEFTDHPGSDLLFDPYLATRLYDPSTRGTFWTKWTARNPYYVGRGMRARNGYLGEALPLMQTQHYKQERLTPPDSSGRVALTGRDPLSALDDSKAQAPKLSTGKLLADLPTGAASFTVFNAVLADYDAAPGWVRINDEVIGYGSLVLSGSNLVFGTLTRGMEGTEEKEHSAEDLVQRCLRFTDEPVVDVLTELLQTYAGIPASQIDVTGWGTEASFWLTGYELSTLITEPVGVGTLVGEICEQVQLFIWWDDRTQRVKLMAIRPPLENPIKWNEEANITLNSQSFTPDPDQRISQIWLYYRLGNPTKNLDEESNYSQARVRIDADAEGPNEFDETKVKKIFSRWLRTSAQAIDVGARILSRYRDDPIVGSVTLDAKDRATWTGDLVEITTRLMTDATGLPVGRRFQIISAQEVVPGEQVKYELQNYDSVLTKLGRYMANGAPAFTAASDLEKARGCFYSDAAGLMSDGSDGYTYQ